MLKTLFALIGVVLAIQSISVAKACTLTGTWQDVQVIGAPSIDDNFFFWNVAKNPIDGTLWFQTWGFDPVTSEWANKIYKQSTCDGKFVLDRLTLAPAGSSYGTAFIDFDPSGNLWMAVDELDASNTYRKIKKRTYSTGVWSDVSTLTIPTTAALNFSSMSGLVVRNTTLAGGGTEIQVWILGWNLMNDLNYPGSEEYSPMLIWKWRNTGGAGTWTSFDLHGPQTLEFGNNAEPNTLRVAPDGKIWAGGRQEMDGHPVASGGGTLGDYVHALLWVEKSYNDPTGFDLKIDYRQNSGTGPFDDSWDRFRDVAFSSDGLEYFMTHTSRNANYPTEPQRSRIFRGTVANPSAYTVIDDSTNLAYGWDTVYSSVTRHPNNQFIISTVAWSSADWYTDVYSLLRVGPINGPFTTTWTFLDHDPNFQNSYIRDPYTIVDNSQNLWAIGTTYRYASSDPEVELLDEGRIIIKKMLCQ